MGLSEALRWLNHREQVAKAPHPADSHQQQIGKPEVKATEKQERVFVGESVTPDYLVSFFHGHTSIQAAKLTEAYMGKWMKVTGSVGEVMSSTPAFAQVTFQERGDGHLFMMFRKPWMDRVAILRRGEKVAVIGQIERVDAVSVQLTNCELVEVTGSR